MKEYMLVLKGSLNEWRALSKEQRDEIMGNYGAWVGTLAQGGIFLNGSELTDKVKRVRRINGENIVDGPFPESKEALTGYFVIKAENMEEAIKISYGCPALTHGESVEVYEKPGNCEV